MGVFTPAHTDICYCSASHRPLFGRPIRNITHTHFPPKSLIGSSSSEMDEKIERGQSSARKQGRTQREAGVGR